MPGFYFDSKHIEAPKISNSSAVGDAIKSVNPFSTLRGIWNDYLQGQHNIGVAEAKNELLNADSRDAVLSIMDRLRAKGLTETQLNDANAQEILKNATDIDFKKAQQDYQIAQTAKLNLDLDQQKYLNDRVRIENYVKDAILPKLEMSILESGPASTKGWVEHYLTMVPAQHRDMARKMMLDSVDKTQMVDILSPDIETIKYYMGQDSNRNAELIEVDGFDAQGNPIKRLVPKPTYTFEQEVRKLGSAYDVDLAKAKSSGLPVNAKGEIEIKSQEDVLKEINERYKKAYGDDARGLTAFNGVLNEAFSRYGANFTPSRIAAAVEAVFPFPLWGDGRDSVEFAKIEKFLSGHTTELKQIQAAKEYLKYGNIVKEAANSLGADIIKLQSDLAILDANKSMPVKVKESAKERLYRAFEDKNKNTVVAMNRLKEFERAGNTFEKLLPKRPKHQESPNMPTARERLEKMIERREQEDPLYKMMGY